jgi:hypothetical protein
MTTTKIMSATRINVTRERGNAIPPTSLDVLLFVPDTLQQANSVAEGAVE